MTDKKKDLLIYVGNDDGFQSKGIRTLIEIASEFGYVVAVAPDSAQSGKSSAITINVPLRVKTVEENERFKILSVDGTPTDCVKIAMHDILDRKPDLVLAGINHGYNTGNCTIYSGTMGVTFEGCMLKVPSIGFSIGDHKADVDFSHCRPFIAKVIKSVIENGLPQGVCLNVNFPTGPIEGLKVTKGSQGFWFDEYEKRVDPWGRPYYWMVGSYENEDKDNPMGDIYWCERGWGSVTPCRPDQTAYSVMDKISDMLK